MTKLSWLPWSGREGRMRAHSKGRAYEKSLPAYSINGFNLIGGTVNSGMKGLERVRGKLI
jgi:hypothetical protein